MIVATIIALIDQTGERVGNDNSMTNGHFGVSNLMIKHITIDGDVVSLTYTEKSGVKHNVSFSNSKIAKNLKYLRKINKNGEIFVTSDGLSIKNTQVNRYLKKFNISSKDLRGFKVNKLMSDKLRKMKKPSTDLEIKKVFNNVLREVAEKIGHTPGICRKNYLLPEIESAWYNKKQVQQI